MTAQELYELIGRARGDLAEIRRLHALHVHTPDVTERLAALSGLLASATLEEAKKEPEPTARLFKKRPK